MTQLQHWAMDPLDIVWKNFFDANSTFNPFTEKINYPVDVYETETGIIFELAIVGLDSKDIDIEIQGDILHVKYDKKSQDTNTRTVKYIHRGIVKKQFDLAWKIANKFNLSKLEAYVDKGLLKIEIPHSAENEFKKIQIKPKESFKVS